MRWCFIKGPLTATLRDCLVNPMNRRMSVESPVEPPWVYGPSIHAVVVESVWVEEEHQRQGHFSRFIATLLSDVTFDMVVVEGVQNSILADWLTRRGWESDREVMDFYHLTRPQPPPSPSPEPRPPPA